MLKRTYHERVKLIGKGRGDVSDAERLRKQLYSMRKLIEVIAEQPNGRQTTAVYTIEGQIAYKVFASTSVKFILHIIKLLIQLINFSLLILDFHKRNSDSFKIKVKVNIFLSKNIGFFYHFTA